MEKIKVAIAGSGGRMGKVLLECVAQADDLVLHAALENAGSPLLCNVVADGVKITADMETALKGADVLIDFTRPEGTLRHLEVCRKLGVNMVIGTTGFSAADVEEIRKLVETNEIGAVMASNFAIGAIVMMHLAKVAARYFDYAEIIEFHHNMKMDAPSGTALSTAKSMAQARGKPFNRPPVEKGEALKSRGEQTEGISIHSVRLPGLLAHQEVIMGAAGQTLTIRHDTIDRDCFMPGVILAIKAVVKRPGLTVGLAPILGLEG